VPALHFMGLAIRLGRADSYRPTRPARVPPPARIRPLDSDRTASVTSGVDGKRNTVHPVGKQDTVRCSPTPSARCSPTPPRSPPSAGCSAALGVMGPYCLLVPPPCAHQGHAQSWAPRPAPAGIAARLTVRSIHACRRWPRRPYLLLRSARGHQRAGGPSCSELVHPRCERRTPLLGWRATRGTGTAMPLRPRRRRVCGHPACRPL